MCKRECIGDYFRPCGHWVFDHETGELVDCDEPKCRTSTHHEHGENQECDCPPQIPFHYLPGEGKVRNMFLKPCPACSTRGRQH